MKDLKKNIKSMQPTEGLLYNHLDCGNISPIELAKILGVSMSQIRKWNKEGITENNKYADQIRSLLPRYPFKASNTTLKGNDDNRALSGRHKKQLSLTEVQLEENYQKELPSFNWEKANKFIPGRKPQVALPTIKFKKEK